MLITYLRKYAFPVKQDVNVKVLNIITRTCKAKTLLKHILSDCKHKVNSTICSSSQKWNNEICRCECKSYGTCTEDYSWNPSACICENDKYLKIVADTSVIVCDEIKNAKNSLPTNVANTIPTNFASTVSINSNNKKVRYEMDCYILHIAFLVIYYHSCSLLFTIITQNLGQNKNVLAY